MKIIGLAGMPGSGKSTVASILQENGAAVIDCDDTVAQIYSLPYSAKIVAEIVRGPHAYEIINNEGGIDKAKLANIIFSDEDSMKKLITFIHPMVVIEVCRRLKLYEEEGRVLTIIEGVFLYESKMHLLCDKVWFVDALEEIRHKRLKKRGWDANEIRRREARICTTHQFSATIDNSNTKEELRKAIEIFMDTDNLRDPRAEVMNLALEHFAKTTETRKQVIKMLIKAAEVLSGEIQDMQVLMKELTK